MLVERLFGSTNQFFLKDGFVYLPLPVDAEIKATALNNKEILLHNQTYFIKSLNLRTVFRDFPNVDPQIFEFYRDKLLSKMFDFKVDEQIENLGFMNDLAFKTMPYFTGMVKLNEKQILDEISKTIPSAELIDYEQKAAAKVNMDLNKIKLQLDHLKFTNDFVTPREVSSIDLEKILENELNNRIVMDASQKTAKELSERRELMRTDLKQAAVLLYLQNSKKFQFKNFGFIKNYGESFTVYLELKRFALRHFDGSIYLFEPCKIAVTINADSENISHPFVIGRYMHPFLPENHLNNNPICIRGYNDSESELNKRIIYALDTGTNTILYGYFNKNYHGYHRLDGLRSAAFEKQEISRNDPRIKSGEIIITNDPFIKPYLGSEIETEDLEIGNIQNEIYADFMRRYQAAQQHGNFQSIGRVVSPGMRRI